MIVNEQTLEIIEQIKRTDPDNKGVGADQLYLGLNQKFNIRKIRAVLTGLVVNGSLIKVSEKPKPQYIFKDAAMIFEVKKPTNLTAVSYRIIDHLEQFGGKELNALAAELGLSVIQTTAQLEMLEKKNKVKKQGEKYYGTTN